MSTDKSCSYLNIGMDAYSHIASSNDFFSDYLERYCYSEEEIDEADVYKYEKMEPDFMDYDVSSVFRDIQTFFKLN